MFELMNWVEMGWAVYILHAERKREEGGRDYSGNSHLIYSLININNEQYINWNQFLSYGILDNSEEFRMSNDLIQISDYPQWHSASLAI